MTWTPANDVSSHEGRNITPKLAIVINSYYKSIYNVVERGVIVNIDTARSMLSYPPKVDRKMMRWEGAVVLMLFVSLGLAGLL